MSRVSVAALVMIALACGGAVARADDAAAQPASEPRWHLDVRAGWAASWTATKAGGRTGRCGRRSRTSAFR